MTKKELLRVIAEAAKKRSTDLDLSGKRIARLPPEIGQFENVTSLYLGHNRLTTLPPEIGQLKHLQVLDLQRNELAALQPELGQLPNLTLLILDDNQLTTLPPELGRLENLEELWLNRNRLAALPPELGALTRLRRLYVQDNQLTVLPPEIGQLKHLQVLDIQRNQLTALRPDLGQLPNLKELSLQGNRLTALPPELGQLRNLRQLGYGGNPLVSPPPEVVAQGTKAILAYLRAQQKESRREWVSKLVVVGEGGVGKTELLEALRGRPFVKDRPTTHGIQIGPVHLKHPSEQNVTMQLNAWDFGGQVIYHATHQFFLTKRSLFLLVWNARLGWEQGRLHYWLDAIQAKAPDSPVIIVSTHIDERDAVLPIAELKARYPKIVGHYAVSNSARTGIEELRAALTETAAQLPLMGEKWPKTWLDAAKTVRAGNEKHVKPEVLTKTITSQGVKDEDAPRVAQLLHDLGDILYYPDDPELRDFVVLKPQWVTEYISKVLESDEVIKGDGVFTGAEMQRIWSGLDAGMQEHFLRLMEKFDLSYRTLMPEEVSLVVERLPMDPPKYEPRWESVSGLQVAMRWSLNTLPAGIPTWFIARHHPYSTHTHWRLGGLFTDAARRHLALVKADAHARTVELWVRGPMPYAFFVRLKNGMEFTLDRFPGLKVERLIPCPGHDGKPCNHAFKYDNLVRRIMSDPQIEKIECEESGKQLLVADLLFGLHWRTCNDVFRRIEESAPQSPERQDLLPLIQDKVNAIYRAQQKHSESHCPDVFTLRLADRSGLKKALVGQKAVLQLCCQYPEKWHPTEDGGRYEFEIPAEWLDAIAPHVRYLVRILKLVVPAAAAGYAAFNPALAPRAIEDVTLMTELARCLPEIRDVHEAEGFKAIGGAHVMPERETGAALRALRKLLDELDRFQTWGGLEKVETPAGDYLWLCPFHAEEYQKPTKPAE